MVIMGKKKENLAEEKMSENEEESEDIEMDTDNSIEENVAPKHRKKLVDMDGESDGSNSANESDLDDDNQNANWADAMSKILKTNKPKKKKALVLSRAKKISDVKKEVVKSAGFQVQTVEGEVKEEQIVEKPEENEEVTRKRRKKKEILSVRRKPNILEKDRERTLMKIATKGVVQLFNAVKTQQRDIKMKLREAGPLEVRKEKVLKNIDKRSFLDVLMGEKSKNVDEIENMADESKKEKEADSTWNVLRDDFMMGAKMKDWDKELEGEMEDENNVELE